MRTQAPRGNLRWATALALAAIAVATACGGGGTAERSSDASVNESKPYLQSDGPLYPPVLVGVRPNGQPRQPALGFSTTDTEVNAFVALGDGVEEDATLVVAWFRLTPGGREHLFSHEIKVKANGRARSQGLARSGLPPGIYESVGTLGDRQVRTLWGVAEGRGAQRSSSAAARTLQASGSEIEPGASGFDDSASGSSSEPSPTSGPCRLDVQRIEVEMELSVTMYWGGQCATVAIGARVRGPTHTLRSFSAPEAVNEIGTPQTYQSATGEVCQIPGGSDLPGTVVEGVATDSGGASASAQEVLEDNSNSLIAILVSEPETGSRIQEGDRIKLITGGLVLPPALGVKSLSVDAGGEPIETVGNLSGSSEPRACDKGRLLAKLDTEYVVPADPPPIVTICAKAVGFDGTAADECAVFPTRNQEVWQGTMDGTITVVPPGIPGEVCPNPIEYHGEVLFFVEADGSVTGTVDVTGAGPPCIGSFDLSGRKTERGIVFSKLSPFFVDGPIPLVSPGRAEDRVTFTQVGTTRWDTEWNLECKTCREESE